MTQKVKNDWLLLIHQIPQPDAFRVKIWRRIQKSGAVSLKNSVYILPAKKATQAVLEGIAEEIKAGGGEAYVCNAGFIHGLSENDLIKLFNADRDKAYEELIEEIEPFKKLVGGHSGTSAEKLMKIAHSLGKVRRQFNETVVIDYFSAKGRKKAESLICALESAVNKPGKGNVLKPLERQRVKDYQGRIWVTRKNLFVDRLASAWLIERFIDRKPKFQFIDPDRYQHRELEVRFDMVGGEFTHHGDLCTFETLCQVFELSKPALVSIAEIIHDIDLKDQKFNREEKPGIERLITGIARHEATDEKRLARAYTLFDDLYSSFERD